MISVSEVTGMEGDLVTLQDIDVFDKPGLAEDGRVMGRFAATGIRPKFDERFLAAEIRLNPGSFEEELEV